MRWGALICVLAIGCGDAGALEPMTDDEPQCVHVDAGAEALELAPVDAGTEPEQLIPNCIGLLPSYLDRWDEHGIDAAQAAVEEWLTATGHDAGDIPVLADGSCDVLVDSAPVEPDEGKRRYAKFASGKTIILNTRESILQKCDDDSSGALLSTLLKHELGHVFGCSGFPHPETGLMKRVIPKCETVEVDGVAIACASKLNRVSR